MRRRRGESFGDVCAYDHGGFDIASAYRHNDSSGKYRLKLTGFARYGTPMTLPELEAELRRRADAAHLIAIDEQYIADARYWHGARRNAFMEAADLVRDAAKGE